ncbi:MAG: lipolytic protein G-D-S-L family [Chloroflexi bacterium]|nr:MAG: lipolytic protein G-D-S-L family [Chloroflexota bacterium]
MSKWLINLCIILVSTLLGLALGEVYLHVNGFSYPSLYVADGVTGHVLRPGAEGWFREEGEAFIKINTDGWRDRPHSKQKPAGTKRIAILADSYAEALQVPQDQAFWSVLEKELNTCHAFGNMRVEVMNFGVSGYGTAQDLLVFQDRVWQYVLDIVILAFTARNDVRDNSKVLSGTLSRPYFVNERGSLVLDNSFTESSSYRLKRSGIWMVVQEASDRFRIVQFLNLVLNRVNQIQQRSFQQSDGVAGLEPGLDDNVYREPAGTEWEEAWRITEDLILNLRNEVVGRGAQYLLVSLFSGIQVHPNSVMRTSFVGKLGASDLFYPERRLQKLGRQEKFDVFALAPQLLEYAEDHQAYLHGFKNTRVGRGHWNKEGHRLAGQLIARNFCSKTV